VSEQKTGDTPGPGADGSPAGNRSAQSALINGVSVFASLVGIVFAVAAFPTGWLKVLGLLTCAVAGALMNQAARDRDRGKLSNAMLVWLSLSGVVVLLLVISFAAAQSGQQAAADHAASSTESAPTGPSDTYSEPSPEPTSETESPTTQSATSPAASAPDEAVYRDKQIKLSPPDCDYGLGTWPVDFDEPAVNGKWADLQYNCESADSGGLIESEDAQNFGDAPAGAVTATSCQDSAQTTGHVSVNVTDVVPKKSAWCVITHTGQIAWIRVTAKGVPFAEYTNQPTLTLLVTLWPPA
jgi:hypothetical protein